MLEWIMVLVSLLSFAYNQYNQNNQLTNSNFGVKQQLQIQYYTVAYDPNTNKLYYLDNNGYWNEQPPQVREYQNQGQEALGVVNGSSTRPQGYYYGQPPQAIAYP